MDVIGDFLTIVAGVIGDLGVSIYHERKQSILVGGLEHLKYYHILGIIIPTDFHIFQRS